MGSLLRKGKNLTLFVLENAKLIFVKKKKSLNIVAFVKNLFRDFQDNFLNLENQLKSFFAPIPASVNIEKGNHALG